MAAATAPKETGAHGGRRRRAEAPPPLPPPVAVRGLPEGATPLMYACQQGRDHEVRKILAEKPGSASERDRTLKTALHYCAENASPACADALLSSCPSLLDASDEEGYTTFHLAVISGNRALLRLLIEKGANVSRMDREGHSAVHWATVCGEVEALEMVIAAGANPSTPDIHGGYPVHYAAQMCGANSTTSSVDPRVGLAVLRRLLAHKVKVDVVDKDGRQPILWAASAGSADAIIALVHAGAGVEAHDKDGLTALHCAASRGHTDCLETLVTLCGAEVEVIDANGCTALFYAATLGHADSTRLLLGFGAQPNRQDRKGRTAAHCGAAKGQLETLRLLSDVGGADLWIRNVRGDLPLHEAVQSGRRELVRWLLQHRPAAVNAANNDGRSPLHVAAIHNNVEMCKVLLDSHSLVNPVMRTPRGQMATPLDTALLRGNRGCAKFLQLHGGVPASKLTEESARLHGGGPGGDRGSPADLSLDTGVPLSAREPDSLGNVPPLLIGQQTRSSPPQDVPSTTQIEGFRAEAYGGNVSRATVYPDGHTTATSLRTTEDKFIQVNDDIAIQYVERIRLSENDGDQGEELEEIALLRGKVSSQRRLRGGEEETIMLPRVRSREAEGSGEGNNRRRAGGEKGRGGRGWSKGGEGCIREEEEEEEEEEESEEESMSRKKSRRKRTTRKKTKEKPRRREEESEEEEVRVEEEEEEEEEEAVEGESGEEEEQVVSEEEAEEASYAGKKRKGGRKTVKTKAGKEAKAGREAKAGKEAKAVKRRATTAAKATPKKKAPPPSSSSPGTTQHSTSPEKSEGEEKPKPTKIPVRKKTSSAIKKKPALEAKSAKKKAAATQESFDARRPVKEVSIDRKAVKGERSAKKAVAEKQKSVEDKESSSVEKEREKADETGKKKGPRRSSSKGRSREETDEVESRLPSVENEVEVDAEGSEEDSPVQGTVQGTVQEVVAIVHKEADEVKAGEESEGETGEEEEEGGGVIEEEKVKEAVEEDGEVDEGVVVEGPSEREELVKAEEAGAREKAESIDGSGEREGDEREGLKEAVDGEVAAPAEGEEKGDGEGDGAEGGASEEAKGEAKGDAEGRPKGEDEGRARGEENGEAEDEVKIETKVEAKGEKEAETSGEKEVEEERAEGSVAAEWTGREKVEAATDDPKKGEKMVIDQTGANEFDEEETARADDIEAKQIPGAARDGAGEKVASESDDLMKDRTEDDVSQLAEDVSSMNEAVDVRDSPSKDEGISTFEITGMRTESKEESEMADASSVADGGASTAEADVSIETIVAAGERKGSIAAEEDEGEEEEEREEKERAIPGGISLETPIERREGEADEEREEGSSVKQAVNISYEPDERAGVNRRENVADERTEIHREEERAETSFESSSFVPSLPLDGETPTSSSRAAEEADSRFHRRTGQTKGAVRHRKDGSGSRGREGCPKEPERMGVRVAIGKETSEEEERRGDTLRRQGTKAMPTTSVTQAVQNTVRKYHLERHIFSELLELKRLQIRAGRANENVLVKRLVDNFHGPAGSDLTVGIKRYDGHYTFRSFEKYLYDQLRQLQTSDSYLIPKIKSTDDMEKISSTLKRTRATTASSGLPPDNPALCTHVTHRCHHAAHAYTGIPCAAYITKGGGHHHHDHHLHPLNLHHSLPSQRVTAPRSTAMGSFLPKIETIQNQPSGGGSLRSQRYLDPSHPVTLELSHGSEKRQVISLPTQRLDRPKRYLVTFTIKPGSGTTEGVTITTKEGQVKVGPIKGEKISSPLSESPESDPTSFRHRHAKSL